MKTSLKTPLFIVLLLLCFQTLHAQAPTQVIIANGGILGPGNKVRMASWNLATGNYAIFDSFPASNVHSIHIWGRDAYVCADSVLLRYNLDTRQREAMAIVPGVRRVAVWEDKVLVTKGFGAQLDHFDVRYAENLQYCFSLPALTGNCEGVVVRGDTGYVANPVSFAQPTGNMAVVDLRARTLDRVMDMDTMGKFVDILYPWQSGKVVSVNKIKFNNPQWGFISIYDIPSATFTHHRVDVPVSQGAGIDGDILYANFGGNVGAFDLTTGLLVDSIVVPGQWAAMTLDTVNDRIYVTETDFQTLGWLYGFDYNGNPTDTLEVGVSPEAIAVDYNVTVGTPHVTDLGQLLSVHPQPFADALHIDLRKLPAPATGLILHDLTGRVLLERPATGNGILDVEVPGLGAGIYVLEVQTRKGTATAKVVKAGR
jgi:hypothetical protein